MISQFRKGFTLVELMIVIAIIGVLAAALFPALTGYIQRSRDTATRVHLQKVLMQLTEYLQNNGEILGMGMGGSSWYCVALRNPESSCATFVPGISPILDLTPSDFSSASIGFRSPLVQKVDIGEGPLVTNFSKLFPTGVNDTGKYQYLLHWMLPGVSDANGILLLNQPDLPMANARCKPGIVKWIDARPSGNPDTNQKTGCEMLISY